MDLEEDIPQNHLVRIINYALNRITYLQQLIPVEAEIVTTRKCSLKFSSTSEVTSVKLEQAVEKLEQKLQVQPKDKPLKKQFGCCVKTFCRD